MDVFDVIHTQRAIRRFKPDPVPEAMLWKILDAAIRAPSGSNLQPWAWIVVRDSAKREAIAQAVREKVGGRLNPRRSEIARMEDATHRRMLEGALNLLNNMAAAPVLIVPCLVGVTSPIADPRSLLAGSSIYGAVQNLQLSARALGLGTVLTTFNQYIEDTLRRELLLPSDAIPACIVPVGYPDGQRFGPTTRKPVETVTYWDVWGSSRER